MLSAGSWPGGPTDQGGPTHQVRRVGGRGARPRHRVVQERPEAHQRRLHLHERVRQELVRVLPQECGAQHTQGKNRTPFYF